MQSVGSAIYAFGVGNGGCVRAYPYDIDVVVGVHGDVNCYVGGDEDNHEDIDAGNGEYIDGDNVPALNTSSSLPPL